MNLFLCGCRSFRSRIAYLTALILCIAWASTALAQVALTEIRCDPFPVGPGQNATEVEPHVLANGTTLVASFQTGRISPGGATAIGWATSSNGGARWAHGIFSRLSTGNRRG